MPQISAEKLPAMSNLGSSQKLSRILFLSFSNFSAYLRSFQNPTSTKRIVLSGNNREECHNAPTPDEVAASAAVSRAAAVVALQSPPLLRPLPLPRRPPRPLPDEPASASFAAFSAFLFSASADKRKSLVYKILLIL